MRNHRMYVLGASLLALTLFASACSDSGGDGTEGDGATDTTSAAPKGELTIGVSGAFTENQLVAEMYAQVLEADGYTVNRELELAARDVSDAALESGEIDLKPEYTGFELGFWDPKATANGEPQTVADALAEAATERGIRDVPVLTGQQHERLRDPGGDGDREQPHRSQQRCCGRSRPRSGRARRMPRAAVLHPGSPGNLRDRVR